MPASEAGEACYDTALSIVGFVCSLWHLEASSRGAAAESPRSAKAGAPRPGHRGTITLWFAAWSMPLAAPCTTTWWVLGVLPGRQGPGRPPQTIPKSLN